MFDGSRPVPHSKPIDASMSIDEKTGQVFINGVRQNIFVTLLSGTGGG